MDILYAPWREKYFSQRDEPCVFCGIWEAPENDRENKVIYRNEELFIVMNKFPYTPGHILIVPKAHADSPELLEKSAWLGLFEAAQNATKILYDYGASGINLGMNIKAQGGAGIPAHLHLHLLPRWSGDTNFLTTIAGARSFGVDFEAIFERFCALANKHLKEEK